MSLCHVRPKERIPGRMNSSGSALELGDRRSGSAERELIHTSHFNSTPSVQCSRVQAVRGSNVPVKSVSGRQDERRLRREGSHSLACVWKNCKERKVLVDRAADVAIERMSDHSIQVRFDS